MSCFKSNNRYSRPNFTTAKEYCNPFGNSQNWNVTQESYGGKPLKSRHKKFSRRQPAHHAIESLESRVLLSLPAPPDGGTPYQRVVIDQTPGGQPLEKT